MEVNIHPDDRSTMCRYCGCRIEVDSYGDWVVAGTSEGTEGLGRSQVLAFCSSEGTRHEPPDLELSGTELYAEHTGRTEHLDAHELVSVMPVTADELVGLEAGALEPGEVGYIGTCRCGFSTRVRYASVVARSVVLRHVTDEKFPPVISTGASCLSELQRQAVR